MACAPSLRDWLREAPFGLALSSGFFGFFAHAGVLSVLEDEGLTPVRISGSSAGALTGGLWAAGVDSVQLRDALFGLRREHFWDPGLGAGLLRGKLFRARLSALIAQRSFSECRFPVAVSAYDVLDHRTRVLREGSLALAIQASCSVPGLFQPTVIDGRPLLDGGVLDRPGLAGMPTGVRILHHHLAPQSLFRRMPEEIACRRRGESRIELTIYGLPRVGPFRLEYGSLAFEAASKAMRAALDRPCDRVA